MQGGNGCGRSIGLGHDLRYRGDFPERAQAKRPEREESTRAAIGTLYLSIARNSEPQAMRVGTTQALANEIFYEVLV
jgi:hypothetical protein